MIKPFIYTDFNTWTNILRDPNLSSYPLWIANFVGIKEPSVPNTWGTGNWTVHQYRADVLNVVGVTGKADLDRFNLLQEGDSGVRVSELQQQLKDLKQIEFDPGSISGNFDITTKNAVIAFQKTQNLQVDGIVGPVTWVRLLWA